jgi:hypothetical protein
MHAWREWSKNLGTLDMSHYFSSWISYIVKQFNVAYVYSMCNLPFADTHKCLVPLEKIDFSNPYQSNVEQQDSFFYVI